MGCLAPGELTRTHTDWSELIICQASPFTLPSVSEPLRPFFIHPSTSSFPDFPKTAPFLPIICVSASRWVGAGGDEIPTFTRTGKRTVGFDYVPGAGDDDELWARGLTPAFFHRNKERLLQTPRDELVAVVDAIVAGLRDMNLIRHTLLGSRTDEDAVSRIIQAFTIGIPDDKSLLALDLGPPSTPCIQWTQKEEPILIRVLQLDKLPKDQLPVLPLDKAHAKYILALPNPRADGKAYISALAGALTSMHNLLETSPVLLLPGNRDHLEAARRLAKDPDAETGTLVEWQPTAGELVSARKVIIPLALALICHIEAEKLDGEHISKDSIARHLQRLVGRWPDGNPPRVALKRVNEVLMPDMR